PCKTQLASEAFLLLFLKHRRSLLTQLSIIPTSQAWRQGLSNNEGKKQRAVARAGVSVPSRS
ncbi:hypothetical protein, partial [Pseudomonas syringae group genomosp. 3]|uniref:hypothetical protein n=1 Tax=Pseudomonas syringae group genomosp. 3 TaxID=251701 RepID=UPI001C80551D